MKRRGPRPGTRQITAVSGARAGAGHVTAVRGSRGGTEKLTAGRRARGASALGSRHRRTRVNARPQICNAARDLGIPGVALGRMPCWGSMSACRRGAGHCYPGLVSARDPVRWPKSRSLQAGTRVPGEWDASLGLLRPLHAGCVSRPSCTRDRDVLDPRPCHARLDSSPASMGCESWPLPLVCKLGPCNLEQPWGVPRCRPSTGPSRQRAPEPMSGLLGRVDLPVRFGRLRPDGSGKNVASREPNQGRGNSVRSI